MKVLELKDVTVKYNNHTAIENINIILNKNEYVFLVGENGSGKSTLVKAIMGLQKLNKGYINVNIEKSDIAYLSQNNMANITFPATAKEIIMTGTQKHGKLPFYNKDDYENYKSICKKLSIENITNRKIGDLSGGQRQRIMLARALIREPKLLILDEPFSGLDINITKESYNILDELHKNTDITIIMVTHDIEEIKSKDARVISLSKIINYDGNIEDWKGL